MDEQSPKITIRAETKEDYLRITEINDLAFGQPNEGKLVEKLRLTERFIPELSLVAEIEGVVVGHILLYPITIRSGKVQHDTLSLGPMSVMPNFQRSGIGSIMVIRGLQTAKALGHESVIVIGHPDYYPRFGFKRTVGWGIRSPFDVPDEAFMALELKPNALRDKSGIVQYPKTFEDAV
ncbi:MAG: N-acetyltransferase [bacterium]